MRGPKVQPTLQECLLSSLAHPRLGGVLLGLALVEGRLEPRPTHFSCCGGRGLRLSPDAATTYSCKMGERLHETRRIAQLLASSSGSDLAAALPAEMRLSLGLPQALESLHLIAKSASKRGLAWIESPPAQAADSANLHSGAQSGAPSGSELRPQATSAYPSIWSIALAAAWRFGFKVHFVQLHGSPSVDLLPSQDKAAPDLICIARASSFWDPHTAERFETLINYAYGALIPVFLQIQVIGKPPAPRVKAYGKVEALVAQRLAAARAKAPLAWLGPACLGKLLTVTSGLSAPPNVAQPTAAPNFPLNT